MSNDYKNFPTSPNSPALDAFVITPGAGLLAVTPRAVYVGVGGDITVTTFRGTSITLTVPDGAVLPLVVTRVTAATATNILGLI